MKSFIYNQNKLLIIYCISLTINIITFIIKFVQNAQSFNIKLFILIKIENHAIFKYFIENV